MGDSASTICLAMIGFFRAPPPTNGRGVSGGLNETIAFPLLRGGSRHLGLGLDSGRKRRRKVFADLTHSNRRRASAWTTRRARSRCIRDRNGYAFVRAGRPDRCGARAGIRELVQSRLACASVGDLGGDFVSSG